MERRREEKVRADAAAAAALAMEAPQELDNAYANPEVPKPSGPAMFRGAQA